MRVSRRTALRLVLAVAAPAFGAAPSRAQSEADVAQPIVALDDALLAVMKAGAKPFPERFKTLEPAVEHAFDLEDILKTSVGLRWAAMPETEQEALAAVFQRFTIASYVANFDAWNGERFEVLPELRPAGADQVVQTLIQPAKGEPEKIDYQMRQGPSGWKAVDVLLDGAISRVAVQRSDFRALLTGPDAEPLIASLRAKVAKLSGGSIPA
jgi:phospholipid transport system substrate-binding protein